MRRVDELLREVIADEVMRLKDPGLGFITITGVDTAPDLRSAKVYYSVLGDEDQQAATRAALGRAASHIRAGVAGQVRLKYVPELRFEVDEALERGLRMEELLRDLRKEQDEGFDPGTDPEGG
jgi:ribosome-binding factor A